MSHPKTDPHDEKPIVTDVLTDRYISYRKYIIIFGFFLMVAFMFFGMLYAAELDNHTYAYHWIIYGGFLFSGFACFGIFYLLTSPSSKIVQEEPLIRIKERRTIRVLSTFPFVVVFGEYLFFLTMFDDLYSPVIATDFFSFFVFSSSLTYFLLPAALPFFLVSPRKVNRYFVFPISIVSLFIFCQMVNLEVFQSIAVFTGTILTFFWGIQLLSRMVIQFTLHVDRKELAFLPVDILSILIALLLVFGLFAGMFLNIYAMNDSSLMYALSAYTLFSIFYIALYFISIVFFSLDSLFGKFLKNHVVSSDKVGKITMWLLQHRSILGFGFFLILIVIYIIMKIQLDLNGYERIIWIGLVSFMAAIFYDAWHGPISQ